ncbi:MAG: hypothetical protein KAG56_03335 [Sulfurovaceae bacterium]|nr:hypothetical protein [Sulfurovaceae bacterium]
MAVLVHITSEERRKSIKNSGIKTGKDNKGVFFMPVLGEYLISHQWARELKRFGIKNFMAVYFKVSNDEDVWFGKYSEIHKKMPLNSAIDIFKKIEDKLGYEFFIERKIKANEITKMRHISKPMGWRYEPKAHGKAPCPCPMCIQKGGFKTNSLKEKNEHEISQKKAKEIIAFSNDEYDICDAISRLNGKWRKESPEYLERLLEFKDEYLLDMLVEYLAEFRHPLAKQYLSILAKSEFEDIKELAESYLEK